MYSQVGPSLGIRPPIRSDYRAWVSLRAASVELHRPWEPWPYVVPTRESFRAQLDKYAYFLFRLEDDRLVGQCNVNLLVRGPFQNAALGYWTGAPFTGRGYMTEGVRLVLRECFTTLKLHRVEANIIPQNNASLSVARKNGFRHEGFSPRFLQIGGQWRDHERFAMTLEDWQGLEGRNEGSTVHSRQSTVFDCRKLDVEE